MDKTLRAVFTLPNTLFFTIAESWLIAKAVPRVIPQHSRSLAGQNVFVVALLLLIPVNTIAFLFYKVLIYNPLFSPLRSFPAPKTRQITKAWYQSTVSMRRGENFLKWASEDVNTEGVLLLRGALGIDVLLATGPKALQEILATNTYDWEKPSRVRNFLRHVLGDGLIIVEGEQHKFQRKHVKPAFGFRQIKDLYPMMWKKAVAVTDAINQDIASNRVGSTEINSWASKITLDIIGIAGLGREFNTLKNSDDPLVQTYESLLEPTFERFLYFIARTLGPDKLVAKSPWRMNKIFSDNTASLRRITGDLVRDKREVMKTGSDQHFDILSLLINSGDFSDDDLSDQLLTFLAAGHETTSSAFTWAVYLLSTHSDIQTRLREEVRTAFNPSHPEDLASTLERLPLLNGICSETLRLYPTVPVTVRRSNRPTTLLDRSIPAGTDVVISPWVTNRLPALWGKNADKFLPERWINPDGTPNNSGGAESNYAYLTFLQGPRSCIGINFAKAELRCLLAAFVGRFEWELDMRVEEVVPAGVITIKPRDGLRVKLREVVPEKTEGS
ncbi:putative P450 monooxygenase [Elsinoe ampelina]|uniref:Putative P450 monooxygenase n=1 Tax=Elsinoe ampelina TaxID=302913 RepID=A0A6A6GHW9_9PEZI|nr:putative P450 monooxygenase [Elsinoe ampelina]